MVSNQNYSSEPRRSDKTHRYKPREFVDTTAGSMYILALFLSIICWATKYKWCGWSAIICSCMFMGNSNVQSDIKEIIGSFIISIFTTGLTYLHDPSPLETPW